MVATLTSWADSLVEMMSMEIEALIGLCADAKCNKKEDISALTSANVVRDSPKDWTERLTQYLSTNGDDDDDDDRGDDNAADYGNNDVVIMMRTVMLIGWVFMMRWKIINEFSD